MAIFFIMSQAPIFVVLTPVLMLVAVLEMIGLQARRNIAVLSAISLLCIVAAAVMSGRSPFVAALLYAVGVVLAVILILYALAMARRGQQWTWFTGLLLAAVATLAGEVALRAALAQPNAEGAAVAAFTLTFVPAMGALAYGLFAPDIPKLRGSY